MHVESVRNDCFLLLNKQMCDVVFTVCRRKVSENLKEAPIYLANEHLSLISALEIKGEIMNETLNKQLIVCEI